MSCYTLVFYLHPDVLHPLILYSSLSVPHSGPFLSDVPSSSYGAFVFLLSQILVILLEVTWHFNFAFVHFILVPFLSCPLPPLLWSDPLGLVLYSYAPFLALLLYSLAGLCSTYCAFLTSVVFQILWLSLDLGPDPCDVLISLAVAHIAVAWGVIFPLLYSFTLRLGLPLTVINCCLGSPLVLP